MQPYATSVSGLTLLLHGQGHDLDLYHFGEICAGVNWEVRLPVREVWRVRARHEGRVLALLPHLARRGVVSSRGLVRSRGLVPGGVVGSRGLVRSRGLVLRGVVGSRGLAPEVSF